MAVDDWIAQDIKTIIIDVDGTLTDGGIYYDEAGNELKKFCTRDGAGFFAAREVGIHLVVLTGRASAIVKRRMEEFRVDILEQGVKDKAVWLESYMKQEGLKAGEIAFVGDELNDLAAMHLTGFVGCPQDACTEVKQLAQYVSPFKGGEGAVRDVIAFLLRLRGQWDEAVQKIYHFN